MNTNLSNTDRIIRVVIALAALAGAVATGFSAVLGIVLSVVAAIMLATAAVGFCPLYRVLGISTYKQPSSTR